MPVYAKRVVGLTMAAAIRVGDEAVVNDSDGGGRCCSARKRTEQCNNSLICPARSLSSCEEKAAFLYSGAAAQAAASDGAAQVAPSDGAASDDAALRLLRRPRTVQRPRLLRRRSSSLFMLAPRCAQTPFSVGGGNTPHALPQGGDGRVISVFSERAQSAPIPLDGKAGWSAFPISFPQ